MTTQAPETIEALHLWLAEKLPELRKPCPNAQWRGPVYSAIHVKDGCDGNLWVPNVLTDALLEALTTAGWTQFRFDVRFTQHEPPIRLGTVLLFRDGDDTSEMIWSTPRGYGYEPHLFNEALCRAARKALEA